MNQQYSFTDFADLQDSDSFELLENDRISKLTGLTEERIWKSTRMKRRFVLKEGKDPIDIAHEVTDKFLDSTDIRTSDIGALALVHTHYEGDAASDIAVSVANRIGVSREKLVAISYGCAGFPKIVEEALSQAKNLQDHEHVLVLNVETPELMMDVRDPQATPIFASGATATSLWKGPGHTLLFSDSEDVFPPNNPNNTEIFTVGMREVMDFSGVLKNKVTFQMNGELAYLNGQALIEQAARESLERVVSSTEFFHRRILIVAHQPNIRMLKALDQFVSPELRTEHREKGITDVCFVNGMEGMGNVISATIPSVLSRIDAIDGVVPPKEGDIILIPAAGICVGDPGRKMSIGRGAIEWHPNAYRNA